MNSEDRKARNYAIASMARSGPRAIPTGGQEVMTEMLQGQEGNSHKEVHA